ncbi:MAG: o-succinylbenzoate--CoA ligase [candidate division Zixibacteria bacterium]|nr:o-succinylbenzoate--CoA ligase [candidate division Zixibacteria bacterium]
MSDLVCPIASSQKKHPQATALRDEHSSTSYSELDSQVIQYCSVLAAAGVKRGDRAAIAETNRIELPAVLFAFFRMGVTACLLNTRQPEAILAQQVAFTRCKWLVNFDSHSKLPSTGTAAPLVLSPPGDPGPSGSRESQAMTIDQPATILFTSGSTGTPKAVLHTFGNHYYNALGSNETIVVEPGDRWLLSLPVYHVGGLAVLFRCFLAGATVVMADPGDDLAGLIDQHGITHVSLVATQLRRLLEQTADTLEQLRTLKAMLLGGGPIPEPLITRAGERDLPVYRSYGLTEMASQVSTSSRPDGTARVILPYREARIGKHNEVFVRGATRFAGYVQGDKLVQPFDDQGWFATGDTGYIENDGLFVTGRRDCMFVSGGENIHPEQIERVLDGIDGVSQSVVVGLADEEYGCRPVAFVRSVRSLSSNELTAALREQLPGYMIPAAYFPWPEHVPVSLKPDRSRFLRLAEDLSQKQ